MEAPIGARHGEERLMCLEQGEPSGGHCNSMLHAQKGQNLVMGKGGGHERNRHSRSGAAARRRHSAPRHKTRRRRPAEARICFGCARSCRSEEHTSELQSLMRISYAVLCLKKKK